MPLRRVYTSRPLPGAPAQHRASIIVGDVVALAPGASLKVKITHSHHPDFVVGRQYLLCGRRCANALMDGDVVRDENTLDDITPVPLDSSGGSSK